MFENEAWHQVIDFPKYEVSDCGRIRNVESGKVRKQEINARGYPIVVLFGKGGGESKTRYLRQVNQLVAQAFLRPPTFPDETHVWHIDGNLHNCHAENLKWETMGRVREWNEMNRTGEARFYTAKVRNIRTGIVYEDAYDCAMKEGRLESEIMTRCEKGSPRYEYV